MAGGCITSRGSWMAKHPRTERALLKGISRAHAKPTFERTHNGGARLRTPSRSAAPLRVAQVKRRALEEVTWNF